MKPSTLRVYIMLNPNLLNSVIKNITTVQKGFKINFVVYPMLTILLTLLHRHNIMNSPIVQT